MPLLDTAFGRLRGRRAGGAIVFQGIPYATAPRFASPGPTPGWSGVRDAVAPGPASPQPNRPVAVFTHGELPATSEECLSLNVYTPGLDGARPVLVWLHGGGFAVGHAGASLYSGERLAMNADAVVVTVNYRLGSLGWLAHPELSTGPDGPSANWGLLDQIAALEWVRDNIAAFGGAANRVTVAGQSAGALSALDLLVAPAAAGLFCRVVAQSPPLGDVAQPAGAGAGWAQALSAAAGGRGEFDVARLRDLGAEQIVALHEQLLDQPQWRGSRGGALPTVDPGSLPASPAGQPAASPEVDVLIGHTADEGTFFFDSPWRPPPPLERVPDIVAHLCPDEDPREVLDRFDGNLVAIATDAIVVAPLARWASTRAAAVAGQSSVYRYRVDHPGAGPRLRATHTAEVPLLFETWRDGGPGERLGGQASGAAEVARELLGAWTGFLRTGSPGWESEVAEDPDNVLGVFGGASPVSISSASPALTK
jgi:para-nitrobenzyl esterase